MFEGRAAFKELNYSLSGFHYELCTFYICAVFPGMSSLLHPNLYLAFWRPEDEAPIAQRIYRFPHRWSRVKINENF